MASKVRGKRTTKQAPQAEDNGKVSGYPPAAAGALVSAPPRIEIRDPSQGEAIDLDYVAWGTITPASSSFEDQVSAVAWQIDDGPIMAMALFIFSPWEFTITDALCPDVGATYLLTVYAWNFAGDLGTASVAFTRNTRAVRPTPRRSSP